MHAISKLSRNGLGTKLTCSMYNCNHCSTEVAACPNVVVFWDCCHFQTILFPGNSVVTFTFVVFLSTSTATIGGSVMANLLALVVLVGSTDIPNNVKSGTPAKIRPSHEAAIQVDPKCIMVTFKGSLGGTIKIHNHNNYYIQVCKRMLSMFYLPKMVRVTFLCNCWVVKLEVSIQLQIPESFKVVSIIVKVTATVLLPTANLSSFWVVSCPLLENHWANGVGLPERLVPQVNVTLSLCSAAKELNGDSTISGPSAIQGVQ